MDRKTRTRADAGLLPGTLEMLIMKTLADGSLHGYGIASHIWRASAESLQVEEGSLYPALRRLEVKGHVKSKWGQTPSGRRARYYELTALGERELGHEVARYERTIAGIGRVLGTTA